MTLGWIDYPSQGATLSRGSFYSAGWVLRCDTGAYPEAIAVAFFNVDTHEWYYPSSWAVYRNIFRPDVQAAFAGACPNVGNYMGYFVYPVPPPAGRWDMYVTWATYDGGQWTDHRLMTIVN